MSAPQARNLALPALDGEYCVHGIIETASCRACVDVCPRQAWQLDDAALEFDADRCDGCGLCVPTCPGRAIALPSCPARREVAGTTVLVAVCDKVSTITSGAGWIGCLHAISLSDLLRSYGEGNRVWVLAHGDCGACSRGKVESVFSRVAHLNSMLRQRGRPAILLREVSAQAGLSLLAAAVAPATRRGFFRSLARRPATLLNADLVMENGRRQAPGEYLPVGDDAMMPWVVKLDPTCCIACHACARVCPEGAIRFDKEVPAYRLRHRACTGCGLCVDVCERQAVKIRSWAEPTQTSMTLAEKRCRSCGVDFHFPLARTDSSAQCWVCTHSRPSQRLYQVME